MHGLNRAFTAIVSCNCVNEFSNQSFLHYEQLRNSDISSIRPCNGYPERIIFRETDDGIVITILEMNTTHYGNKK